mmetsp:Transcript_40305/g.124519  ORF Transcript_40305/g.124519 Transcript_40305/m.124519 type:complete len:219 (-) Transcript_40305:570-1226(-)
MHSYSRAMCSLRLPRACSTAASLGTPAGVYSTRSRGTTLRARVSSSSTSSAQYTSPTAPLPMALYTERLPTVSGTRVLLRRSDAAMLPCGVEAALSSSNDALPFIGFRPSDPERALDPVFSLTLAEACGTSGVGVVLATSSSLSSTASNMTMFAVLATRTIGLGTGSTEPPLSNGEQACGETGLHPPKASESRRLGRRPAAGGRRDRSSWGDTVDARF